MTEVVVELDPLIVWLQIKWADIFGNYRPIKLEIGFGNGSFLVEMACREPQYNFLGLEIYKKGIEKAKRRIQRAGVSNVRLLHAEAEAALPKIFGPEEVKEIHINFPDPWPKKRHRRRRLVKPAFVETLYQVLEPHGRVYLVTDWPDYFQEALQFFQDHKGFHNVVDGDFLSQSPGERPISKYEQAFLQEGRPIYYLIFEKTLSGKP